jgi:hypothetical protein
MTLIAVYGPAKIGKRIRPRLKARGQKRSAASRAKMAAAAKRRAAREAAVKLHMARMRRQFMPFSQLVRLRNAKVRAWM